MDKKVNKGQNVVQCRPSDNRIKTPQYEYACKEIATWPQWKREISMSGLTIEYRSNKK